MGVLPRILKHILTAFLLSVAFVAPASADESDLDALFELLRQPELQDWQSVEERIWAEWSRSGSAAMDLLLERGKDALEAGDTGAAIAHLSALVDHAPDFAEGYNARALAYFESGRYGPALVDLRQVLALNPRHFGAMTGLAVILEETGHPDAALDAYRQVHALHPHNSDIKTAIDRLERQVEGRTL